MSDWPPQQRPWNAVALSTLDSESVGPLASGTAGYGQATAWPSANRAFFVPFLVYSTITVVKMKIANGATISGNVDIGIYDDQKHRLVSTGSTAHAGASVAQTFDITDTTLQPGRYYAALCSSSSTATIGRVNTATAAETKSWGVLMQDPGSVTLPDPAVWVSPSGLFVPYIGMHLRTTP